MTSTSHAVYSDQDLDYLGREYRTLEELCAERGLEAGIVRDAIARGALPVATYVLPDGRQLFPADYLRLVGEAGGIEGVHADFLARHHAAAQAVTGPTTSSQDEWRNYLSGLYGACLRDVTPENMVRKEHLIGRIEALVAAPRPTDPGWVDDLRSQVDALDALERPFTDYDRQRWGGTSRDTHVTQVRERYLRQCRRASSPSRTRSRPHSNSSPKL